MQSCELPLSEVIKAGALQTLVDNGSSLNIQGDVSQVLKASPRSPALKRMGTAVKRAVAAIHPGPSEKTES